MAFPTPFGGPYMNGPAPWHLDGHFVCSFSYDSGYTSSGSDSPPYPSLDPDNDIHEDTHRFEYVSPWPRYQFVHAQYSHPAAAFRPQHPYHGSSNETYILPQPLPFEQQRSNYQYYISQPNQTPSHHARNLNREPSPPASLQDIRVNTPSPLNFNESAARLPPLNDRVVETETEVSSSPSLPHPSNPIPHNASPPYIDPELKTKTPPPPRSESSHATPFIILLSSQDGRELDTFSISSSWTEMSSRFFFFFFFFEERRGGDWRISGGGCMRSERKAFEGEKRAWGRKDGDVFGLM